MHVDLVVALVVDVGEYLFFLEAQGGDEVAASPERAGWEFLCLFLEPHRTFAFQDLHDVRR